MLCAVGGLRHGALPAGDGAAKWRGLRNDYRCRSIDASRPTTSPPASARTTHSLLIGKPKASRHKIGDRGGIRRIGVNDWRCDLLRGREGPSLPQAGGQWPWPFPFLWSSVGVASRFLTGRFALISRRRLRPVGNAADNPRSWLNHITPPRLISIGATGSGGSLWRQGFPGAHQRMRPRCS
jgi:hypothetical protein